MIRLIKLTRKLLVSSKNHTIRPACNNFATEYFGGDVILAAMQDVCSYTVYAGRNVELVAPFRLNSLRLNLVHLAGGLGK